MARLILMIVLLVAAALANESSNKPEESEFRQEILKNFNKTNEKLDRLMRIVFNQPVEMRRFVEEQKAEVKLELMKFANATNDKLDQLAKTVDQRFDQALEKDRQIEEQTKNNREKLDALANITEHHIQHFQIRFLSHCSLARSSNLTLLSNGKKYSFHQTKKNWTSANEFCSKNGLNLATITDLNDAHVVAAQGRRIISGQAWWVSAKNEGRGSEMDFRWLDGTRLELDSLLWWDGANKTNDCVIINNWTGGKLWSDPCINPRFFICKLPSEC
ncbi:uncharacterized protein LOC132194001 [Neocloeon triangulifer]|uniref:uncharacterized protein LOC132194001 n=1 Tax=Neocloeon triangulifer TaxID=2078957 RepID=UPI00286F47E8|nr:uncharacterized protein LOC132194001 [Neocloeon triangulifer]